MHINKVHHVTTINRVAEQLGVDEDWLSDVASEMDIEDGRILVYGIRDDGVLAFTDFGMCALSRRTVLPGGNPGRLTLAPAGSIQGGSGGDE
jgi:hypothetical protein